ncbi:PadR family transcriptional regulator [Paenibacillus sp. YN15]|uniref:PadR family transcriptional regulator n=1 Tax=Paenibacillus sp. YN15 TaxID=1742774 RepID=UPI000DCD50A7|nr:PadR family transcriptional regulator [Paenibacillus sp. YN15]RAV04755.1 PadR family transcriptional regulator [Paenibacillus sp. YN15]
MIDNVILGILMEGPQTGYGLKSIIEQSVGFFYSASYGSLYPALKRLAEQGAISLLESDGSKNKKLYALEPSGRERFLEWLGEPLTRSRNEHLLKFFFYDYLAEPLRGERLAGFHAVLREELGRLAAVKQIVDKETEELENPENYRFRLSVLTYGFRYLEMAERWLGDLRSKETGKHHHAGQGPAAEENKDE